MADQSQPGSSPAPWKASQVYAMAGACLLLGLLLGYLFRDSGSRAVPAPSTMPVQEAAANSPAPRPTPTLGQMQQMADKQAAPLLAKLQKNPTDAGLLNQLGNIYRATHQFMQAAGYYERALKVTPKNVAARTDMASCLYYEGDVDGALDQLRLSLQYDPKDANTLFNLGMIRWQGKKDVAGAIAAWQQLLNSNPSPDAKQNEVKNLIARAQQPGSTD